MGCLQSRPVQQENFNNLSHAEVQQKDIHRQSKDALIDSSKPGPQEHSSSSMVTNHPAMPNKMKAESASPVPPPQFESIPNPQPQREPHSQSVSQRSKSGTSSPRRHHSPGPIHKPEFDTVPSASNTQTPQSHKTPVQNGHYSHQYDHSGGDHFRPPITRQQSHSKSISSARDVPDRVGIKRSESRQRAVTTNEPSRSDGDSRHELPRPASKSDVLPAPSGRFGTLAPAQPISVERAEHASHEKDAIRRSTAGGAPYSLTADPRNARPSISRTFHSAQESERYDPANKPLVDDDDQFQHAVRHHDSESRDENGMPVSQPLTSHVSREINKHNPRARAAKRQSHQWGAIPPPPAAVPSNGLPQMHPQAAMTPASHHQTTYRQNSIPSQYPTGSRTPQGTGVQQQGGWGFAADHTGYNQPQPHMQQRQAPVMYNAPQHYSPQPYGQAMSPYGAGAQYPPADMGYPQGGMPRAQTYHADPRQQQQHPHQQQPQQPQRQMRPYRSQDIAPGASPPPHATPTPPPPGAPGPPTSPPEHHGSMARKKKKKKNRRRLGERGQISEKAFFEKYWIESGVLGEGSFARVRRITRKTDQAPFALKLIKKKGMSEDDLTALEKEISILQKLNHPNVVQITDFCDTSKRIYMVVEFCEGGDVFSRIIAQSKFSEKDASHVIASVTRGLEHCHANGIVHRDLKPDNLMYLTSDPHSEIKIIDFGLAGDLVDGPLKTPCGTAHYVAPEVLEGTAYGCEADMWSMGVILYMLLCGFPPFFDQTGNHHRLYKIIKKGEYSFPAPYWDEISEDAKDLIRNLLVKNPRERLTAQQALRHPWLMGDLVSEADFGKTYMTQMTHFNSSRHFTERRLGTESASPMQQVSLFSAEWTMQGH